MIWTGNLRSLNEGMVIVELKGIHHVKSKGKIYYYAWRGGPKLTGEPGTHEFMASYNEVVATRAAPESGKFRSIITNYKASEFNKLAASTRRVWTPWIDRISEYFGDLSIAQFNRHERIRPIIRRWRGQYSETPRSADTGLQVLSRILSHGVDPMGKIASNPCEGIKHLYSNDRAEIIWTDSDIEQLKTECSNEVAWAVDLAAHTGLRVGTSSSYASRMSAKMPSSFPPAKADTSAKPSSRATIPLMRSWPASQSGRRSSLPTHSRSHGRRTAVQARSGLQR